MDKPTDKFAIHAAAREGKTSVVESLLNANPKSAYIRDDDERLPLHWAVSYNHKPIVDLLAQLKDFDPDVQDGLGWTPLMMAASRPDSDAILALLLAKGADTTLRTTARQTALHFAASKSALDAARALVAHGASARAADRRAQLPLHRAAAVGSVPMLRLLVAQRSALDGQDVDGMTALHHACCEGHGDAALYLLKQGADSGKRDVDGRLAVQTAPDEKVRRFIVESAEREGIELVTE